MNNNNTLKTLSLAETQAVSGGIDLHSALTILELPHVFMGLKEFTNYAVDLIQNGCSNIEEGDHFTQFFCSICTNKSEL